MSAGFGGMRQGARLRANAFSFARIPTPGHLFFESVLSEGKLG
jgi:hypothetical protein